MRIVITGATGNVGTAVVRALLADDAEHELVGIARRRPEWAPSPRVRFVQADIAQDDLVDLFTGADVVVNLAWLIQPSADRRITERVNVGGALRVLAAVEAAGVPALVHASSVAAYGPADPDEPVDESWPTNGIPGSYYSEQKVAVERALDAFEAEHPEVRVVRLRPGLIFQRANASQVRRLFGGPFVPGSLVRRSLIPFVPSFSGLAGQVVHADDVADLYRRACVDPSARGAYNAAAQPPLDAAALGRLLGARPLPIPARLARGFVGLTWKLHLQPVSADWIDLARGAPVMRTDRARTELDWQPQHEAGAVITELLGGLNDAAGFPTPPLDTHAGGRLRWREFRTGVGGPNPEDIASAR